MRRIDAIIEDPPQKQYELINSRDILIVVNRGGMYVAFWELLLPPHL
jgi:hypothetical protein